jgi:hypothetical protein
MQSKDIVWQNLPVWIPAAEPENRIVATLPCIDPYTAHRVSRANAGGLDHADFIQTILLPMVLQSTTTYYGE